MPRDFRLELADTIRDSMHNTVITEENELDNEDYFNNLQKFIAALEGCEEQAYMDGIVDPQNPAKFISVKKFNSLSEETQDKLSSKCTHANGPIRTVGIGANLEIKGVLEKLDKVIGKPGTMQKVYDGKDELTKEDISKIFKHCIEERVTDLRNIYGAESWNKLKANERISILSLYFNNPSLANKSTNFYKHIRNYLNTNDVKHLKLAVEEVEKRSNKTGSEGIQHRRNAEGALLASYKCATCTKPNEPANNRLIHIVELGKTVVPLNDNNLPIIGVNKDFFIWRTELDHKVRPEHALREGKIYRRSSPPGGQMPGESYNCRCRADDVPDHIIVRDEISESEALRRYLRTGKNHPLLAAIGNTNFLFNPNV
jgi:GH24 family phage-related lysozyme (muramidase)